MHKIKKIEHIENKDSYAVVHVTVTDELGNEEPARVFVGGQVEYFFDKGVAKAFVKKKKE